MPKPWQRCDPAEYALAIERAHIRQKQLAERWSVSERTLERWRWKGLGPAYLKIGGRVIYRRADIEDFEAAHLRHRAAPAPIAEPAGTEGDEAQAPGPGAPV